MPFKMTMELTFLGTGTSQGIPMIACECEVCRSDDPHDQRTRTSAVVSLDGHNILIDTTPELRFQCLRNKITRVDAILITHTHADHIFGMDDVRRFNQIQQEPINVYADPEHIVLLQQVFGYARADRASGNPNLPQLNFHEIRAGFELFGQRIVPLPLQHGGTKTLGYRIGPMAYCTDFSVMPEETIKLLGELEVLVLGALRQKPHSTHLSINQAVNLAQRIGTRQTYFVHMSHHVSHRGQQKLLPENIRLAHDTLRVRI